MYRIWKNWVTSKFLKYVCKIFEVKHKSYFKTSELVTDKKEGKGNTEKSSTTEQQKSHRICYKQIDSPVITMVVKKNRFSN